MPTYLQHEDQTLQLELVRQGERVTLELEDGQTLTAEIRRAAADGELILQINGLDGRPRRVRAFVSVSGAERWVTIAGRTWRFTQSSGRPRRGAAGGGSGVLRAPMPGQVRAVQAAVGEAVTKGQTILVLEAMKMEIRITAPFDGELVSLNVQEGQTVEREEVLGEVKSEK